MIESLPGFRGPVPVRDLIAAAIAVAAGPALGWVLYRLVALRVRRTETITSWGGQDIVRTAVRDVAILWVTIGGAFAAVQFLRDPDGAPPVEGLRIGVEQTITNLLIAALILSATYVVARIVSDVIKLYALRTAGTTRSSSIFVVVARVAVTVVGLLILLQTFGVSITPLLTALGVGGLAVAFALQETLSDFFAGLQIIATKKVKPGDFVRLEAGLEGYVADVDWRHTSIRQLQNSMVLVPNARLASEIVTNFAYPESETAVLVDVGVGYDSDLRDVERVTIEVATEVQNEVDGAVIDFEPFIRYNAFADSSVDFTVILRAKEVTARFLLRHEFIMRLHERYRHESIAIPYPIRTVHLDDRPKPRPRARR